MLLRGSKAFRFILFSVSNGTWIIHMRLSAFCFGSRGPDDATPHSTMDWIRILSFWNREVFFARRYLNYGKCCWFYIIKKKIILKACLLSPKTLKVLMTQLKIDTISNRFFFIRFFQYDLWFYIFNFHIRSVYAIISRIPYGVSWNIYLKKNSLRKNCKVEKRARIRPASVLNIHELGLRVANQ